MCKLTGLIAEPTAGTMGGWLLSAWLSGRGPGGSVEVGVWVEGLGLG